MPEVASKPIAEKLKHQLEGLMEAVKTGSMTPNQAIYEAAMCGMDAARDMLDNGFGQA